MKFNFEGLVKALGNEVTDYMKVVELVNQLVKQLQIINLQMECVLSIVSYRELDTITHDS